ncbi:MAG: hypothetical protein JO103_03940 [Candidatus Eremiobacteraeota bacterium]|nr:hypothetical protein [Candidatus Eremiobacteraeota bacterium]
MPLLDDGRPFVRLYAAEVGLLTDEAAALRTLEELRTRSQPPALADNAERVLTHWRLGFLFAWRRSRDVERGFFEQSCVFVEPVAADHD